MSCPAGAMWFTDCSEGMPELERAACCLSIIALWIEDGWLVIGSWLVGSWLVGCWLVGCWLVIC